jgi:hypothetical protein
MGDEFSKLKWAGNTIDVDREDHQCLVILELVLHFSTKIPQNTWELSYDTFTQNCWARFSNIVWEQVHFQLTAKLESLYGKSWLTPPDVNSPFRHSAPPAHKMIHGHAVVQTVAHSWSCVVECSRKYFWMRYSHLLIPSVYQFVGAGRRDSNFCQQRPLGQLNSE